MKKILTTFLACISLVTCIFLGAACSAKPTLDIRKAGDNLRARGYEVEIDYDQELEFDVEEFDIYGKFTSVLYAEREGSDEDYTLYIYEFKTAKAAKYEYEYINNLLEMVRDLAKAQLKYYERFLTLYSADLDADDIEDIEEYIKEVKQELEKYEEKLKGIGRSGKYLWIASHTEVLKDTK